MRKARIAVISRMNPYGGGSFQYGAAILEALAKLPFENFDIHFWYSDAAWNAFSGMLPFSHEQLQTKPSLAYRVIRKGLHCVSRAFHHRSMQKGEEKDSVLDAVKLWNADVCICLEQGYNVLPNNIRVIGPIHDLMHRYEPMFSEVGSPKIYNEREKLFAGHARSASAVLVDSPIGKRHVMECYHADEKKIHILPFIASPLLMEARRPTALPALETPFVFYPAQFWPHKNHVAIIRALAMLPPSLRLHCVFTGNTHLEGYAAACEAVKLAGLEERVHILGYVEDAAVAWLYRHAYALVMPTFFGPTNIPPLEAMQYGCPVIVSGIYGMPEQLGEAALYIDPKRPEQIAEALCALDRTPGLRAELIQKGYARSAQWTKSDFQKSFVRILEHVLAQ